MAEYIVGITGASGSIYALRLVEEINRAGHTVHLVVTGNGRQVFEYELGKSVGDAVAALADPALVKCHDLNNLFSSVASGSYHTEAMIILPCSMATLGEIAGGCGKTLLTRAADVALKERRRLIIVPRETPLSLVHLRNMVAVTEAGAVVLPAAPAFYCKPQSMDDVVNFVVGKILDTLDISHQLYNKWTGL